MLKKGITGFYKQGETLDEIGAAYFKKACYSAQTSDFSVYKITDAVNTSYYEASYKTGEGRMIYVVMNKYYPYIAFVNELYTPDKIFGDLENERFTAFGYTVLKADVLNAPFEYDDHELSTCELDQIDYWKPKNIGSIIFNEWD